MKVGDAVLTAQTGKNDPGGGWLITQSQCRENIS